VPETKERRLGPGKESQTAFKPSEEKKIMRPVVRQQESPTPTRVTVEMTDMSTLRSTIAPNAKCDDEACVLHGLPHTGRPCKRAAWATKELRETPALPSDEQLLADGREHARLALREAQPPVEDIRNALAMLALATNGTTETAGHLLGFSLRDLESIERLLRAAVAKLDAMREIPAEAPTPIAWAVVRSDDGVVSLPIEITKESAERQASVYAKNSGASAPYAVEPLMLADPGLKFEVRHGYLFVRRTAGEG
jgi:hypothetical protein